MNFQGLINYANLKRDIKLNFFTKNTIKYSETLSIFYDTVGREQFQ